MHYFTKVVYNNNLYNIKFVFFRLTAPLGSYGISPLNFSALDLFYQDEFLQICLTK